MKRGMEQSASADKCSMFGFEFEFDVQIFDFYLFFQFLENVFTEFFKGEFEAKNLVSLFEQVLVDMMIEKFDLKNM